jgi:uncharacterized protein
VNAIGLSAAFVAGLAGSAHCFAMCGGMAGALGLRPRGDTHSQWQSAAIYQTGRLASYATMGFMVALFSAAPALVLSPHAVGIASAILRLVGGILLLLLAFRVAWRRNPLLWVERMGTKVWRHLQPLAGKAATASGTRRALALGLLWGWLPCGLVYSMLLFAALSAQPLHGAAIMTAFGLGTLPSMLASSLVGTRLQPMLARSNSRMLSALLLAVCGGWTIVAALQHAGHGMHR